MIWQCYGWQSQVVVVHAHVRYEYAETRIATAAEPSATKVSYNDSYNITITTNGYNDIYNLTVNTNSYDNSYNLTKVSAA